MTLPADEPAADSTSSKEPKDAQADKKKKKKKKKKSNTGAPKAPKGDPYKDHR